MKCNARPDIIWLISLTFPGPNAISDPKSKPQY